MPAAIDFQESNTNMSWTNGSLQALQPHPLIFFSSSLPFGHIDYPCFFRHALFLFLFFFLAPLLSTLHRQVSLPAQHAFSPSSSYSSSPLSSGITSSIKPSLVRQMRPVPPTAHPCSTMYLLFPAAIFCAVIGANVCLLC